MDQESDNSIVETATAKMKKYYEFIKKTLHFLLPVSLLSFLFSYFSGFAFFSYNIHFSTLIFSLSAQALDRKYMFLICNGILAFLARNLNISSCSSSSTSLSYGGFMKSDEEDDIKQTTELPRISDEGTVQENAATMEHSSSELRKVAQHQEQDSGESRRSDHGEINGADFVPEGDDYEEEQEEEEEEVKESRGVEGGGTSSMEEVNEARVSTEELNMKIEEFIRKMKEEIRIEAQQPLIAV